MESFRVSGGGNAAWRGPLRDLPIGPSLPQATMPPCYCRVVYLIERRCFVCRAWLALQLRVVRPERLAKA